MLFTDGLFEVEIANGEFYGQERLLTAVRDQMRLPAGNSSAKCSRKFGSAVCGANSRMTCVSWDGSYAPSLTPAGESHEQELSCLRPSRKTPALPFMNLAVTHTTAYRYSIPVVLRGRTFSV